MSKILTSAIPFYYQPIILLSALFAWWLLVMIGSYGNIPYQTYLGGIATVLALYLTALLLLVLLPLWLGTTHPHHLGGSRLLVGLVLVSTLGMFLGLQYTALTCDGKLCEFGNVLIGTIVIAGGTLFGANFFMGYKKVSLRNHCLILLAFILGLIALFVGTYELIDSLKHT